MMGIETVNVTNRLDRAGLGRREACLAFMQSHHSQPSSVLSYKQGIMCSRDRWRRKTWIPVIVRLVTGRLSVSYIPPLIKDYTYSGPSQAKHFSMWSHLDCLRFLWFARTITILDFNDTKARQRRRCDINHYRSAQCPPWAWKSGVKGSFWTRTKYDLL